MNKIKKKNMTKYRIKKIQKAYNNLYEALEQLIKATQGNMNYIVATIVYDEESNIDLKELEDFQNCYGYGDLEISKINAEWLMEEINDQIKNEKLNEVLENNKISALK